jgi:hypothetical protein
MLPKEIIPSFTRHRHHVGCLGRSLSLSEFSRKCHLFPHLSASSIFSFHTVLQQKQKTVSLLLKWSRYRPGVAQRVGRGIALLFYDRGPRSGWVVSSTPRLHFTTGKDPVPIVQEAGWAPGPVWRGRNLVPTGISIPDCPARSQSLYQLSYRAHFTSSAHMNMQHRFMMVKVINK